MHRDNKIFKLCRVHNLEDYLTAVNNGVNMIGIHAVYTDFDAYRAAEEIYNPIEVIPNLLLELVVIIEVLIASKCVMLFFEWLISIVSLFRKYGDTNSQNKI